MRLTPAQLRKIIKEEISRLQESKDDKPGFKFDITAWVNDPSRTRDQLEDAYHELTKEAYGVSASTSPDDIEVLKSEIIELHNSNNDQSSELKVSTPKKQSLSDLIKQKLSKSQMTEAMSRITPDEVEAWKNGDWGYVSSDKMKDGLDALDALVDVATDPERFLHGKDPHDDEGSMVKSRLYSMKEMAKDICDIVQPQDQLPGWVQDHISVAHENLQQVHGYLMGRQHAVERPMIESKKTLSEAHNRITKEEMNAWLRGDWGFTSDDSDKED